MVAVIQHYVTDASGIESLPLILSGIGFAAATTLIADSIFLVQKPSHSQIMESLLKVDKSTDKKTVEDKEPDA